MFDPDDDLLYEAAIEDYENRLASESYDEDGEESLSPADRNPSMIRRAYSGSRTFLY